ncbi:MULTISPECIES: Holliday junction branch migration protein RuvA [unclassified Sphingomonas]|uniref:Holliday junction branch migration protein RuvA n=1 Tax=unclassified Sphingomonas TaxID=196159 RepID=UPI0006F4831C|nr:MULTISPECIES: Holliday junction branch migration protein RuvA [unclassified Sphingomonas]KQX24838.1 ATP-dependent DNA helicase RuvA [Sphingomonas sp. Root1294]KQY69826.1 ATP-dependent DNA helicase RuvA [Sphingomonas sp. Root50]KRB93941.1 ATP-dependent DNA helicase RuvA [Sphingomonas sp. Root720]
MIARLRGVLAETGADHAVLDVGGVGYLVWCSGRTLTAIGEVGGDVLLFTEMQVREDAITLYGFGSAAERETFRLLTGVQGVGGRVALSILSVLDAGELSRAIASGDKAMVARANGVGPKLAMRIVNELKDKMGGVPLGPGLASAPAARGGVSTDALSALANLGFRPAEASSAVGAAIEELGDGASLDAVVRLALRKAAK